MNIPEMGGVSMAEAEANVPHLIALLKASGWTIGDMSDSHDTRDAACEGPNNPVP